jgi:hypothetical protein
VLRHVLGEFLEPLSNSAIVLERHLWNTGKWKIAQAAIYGDFVSAFLL